MTLWHEQLEFTMFEFQLAFTDCHAYIRFYNRMESVSFRQEYVGLSLFYINTSMEGFISNL
jgi:hypothetical protein